MTNVKGVSIYYLVDNNKEFVEQRYIPRHERSVNRILLIISRPWPAEFQRRAEWSATLREAESRSAASPLWAPDREARVPPQFATPGSHPTRPRKSGHRESVEADTGSRKKRQSASAGLLQVAPRSL